MNHFLKCFLILILFFGTACTTLTGAERCALIGQVQEGTQIGTQTHVGSVGHNVYSYNTPSYNPICKLPKTEEEKAQVADVIPIAREKQSRIKSERIMYWAGVLSLLIVSVLLVPGA